MVFYEEKLKFVSLLQVYLVHEIQLPIIYIMSTKINLIKNETHF